MMKLGIRLGLAACTVVFTASTLPLAAQEAKEPKVKTVAAELDNPCGLVVHPGTRTVFISTHPAIYQLTSNNGLKLHTVVNGFSTDIYGKGPKYNLGPLGLAFLDDETLVVGDGSHPDGEEYVLVFKVSGEPPAKAQKPGDAVQVLGPIKAGEASAKGEGNFYALALSEKALFVTSNGDDTKGWVLKADRNGSKLGELKPGIATKLATEVDAPVGITMSKDGKELIVGQMGEINIPGDSLYTTYDPESGELKAKLKTGLNDISGIAVSPKTGKIYAVDFSWIDTSKGGLFRLDIEGEEVKAEKILSLDKPSALAFDPEDGSLYISVLGTAEEGSDKAPGKVLKVEPGL